MFAPLRTWSLWEVRTAVLPALAVPVTLTIADVDNAAGLVSVAVMVAVPVEVPAVKTHEVVFVHAVRKLPSPVAPQLTVAFAVKVWV